MAIAGTAVALASNGRTGPPSGPALAALAKPPLYTSLASQRVYLVMTDRYANGDRSNDRGGLTGGPGACRDQQFAQGSYDLGAANAGEFFCFGTSDESNLIWTNQAQNIAGGDVVGR